MPTYEYQCKACGHELEAFQKMTDAPLIECPKCNQQTLTKLISGAGFQLKGSGWYVTDYSKKGKSSAEKSSEGSGSDSQSTTPSTDSSTNSSSGGSTASGES